MEYVSCEPSEGMKELFPEEYGEDDDSFEEEEKGLSQNEKEAALKKIQRPVL